MKNSIFALSLIFIFLQSCSKPDDDIYMDSVCDQITIVDNAMFRSTPSAGYLIESINLTGDCLEIAIVSGGCSGNTWKVELIDAGRVAESYPEQRNLKISLDNQELCNALVGQTYTFDLRPLQTGNNVVLLNLEQWEVPIRYEY